MDIYATYKQGTVVDAVDDNNETLVTGTITRQGTAFVVVTDIQGNSYDIPYPMLRLSGIHKTAASEVIKEEENEGKKFTLLKEDINKDGVLSTKYVIEVDGKPVQESEEIVMNVYNTEFGWSAPDDFDENKVDLLKSTYESGFDLIVESYQNIEKNIKEVEATPPAEPVGKPAFVPGVTPKEPVDTNQEAPGAAPEAAPADIDISSETAESEEGLPPEGSETEESTEGVETVGASLERTSFARSVLAALDPNDPLCGNVLAAIKSDDRLHGNPQHRINPLVRQKMKEKGIDSGYTNDLALADLLKDYDYNEAPPKK